MNPVTWTIAFLGPALIAAAVVLALRLRRALERREP